MNFIAYLLSYSYMYYNALSIYDFFIDNLSIVHIRILFICYIHSIELSLQSGILVDYKSKRETTSLRSASLRISFLLYII